MNDDKAVKTRTERDADAADVMYILAPGAPAHYVAGYGRCVGGDFVGIPPGQEPGHWYHKVSAAEYAEAQHDEAVLGKLQRRAADAVAKKPDPRVVLREKLLASESSAAHADVPLKGADKKAVEKAQAAAADAQKAADDLAEQLAALQAERDALAEQNGALAARNSELEGGGEYPAGATEGGADDGKGGKGGK